HQAPVGRSGVDRIIRSWRLPSSHKGGGGRPASVRNRPRYEDRPLREGRQPADRPSVVPRPGLQGGPSYNRCGSPCQEQNVAIGSRWFLPLDTETWTHRGLVAAGWGWSGATSVAPSPPSKLR